MTEASKHKTEYRSPKLVRYGTLSELTQAGDSNPGDDFIVYDSGVRGSVITPNPRPGDRGPGA